MSGGDGQRRVTLAWLAEDLGVSRATVSNAYNHPDQLSEALRTRILGRAAEVGFTGPNPLARSLRRRRVGAVGVLLGEPLAYAFGDPGAVAILAGLAEALQVDRRSLLLIAGDEHGAADPALVTDAAVDAWVADFLEDAHPFVVAAQRRQEPMVVLDQPRLQGVPRVGVDDAGGTRMAMEHLLRLGHRRVGVLSLPFRGDHRSGVVERSGRGRPAFALTRRRLAGVDQAVARAAPAVRRATNVQIVECARNDPASGTEAASLLLAARERPTALVAMTDQLAIGGLQAADAAGLSVPRDVSVIGFDDIPEASVRRPALTTVRQPLRAKGRYAGEVVRAVIDGRPARSRTFPVELVIRESTAPPAS